VETAKKGGCSEDHQETSKGWVCDNFPRQFHFFLGTFHEKHKFKYFKNLTVKVCKIWCNDVYMSIRQCDIFWKNPDSHPAVLLNSLKFCAPVVFV
jgi:hypothetical protein